MSWPKAALGDVFEIARGGSPRPIEKFLTDEADGFNWVSISDATRSGKIIERTERKIRPEGLAKSRWVEPGDFLLSNSMSFGRPYIMGTTGCIHDGWLVLKPGKTPVDSNYLYHLLGSEPVFAQFAKRATGTTVKNLNTQIVSETVIPLPPLPEQRRIAAILDQADALRRLRRQSLSRLSDLGHAFFASLLGADLSSRGRQRLGDFADVQVGYPFKSELYSQDDDGVSLCRGTNVLPDKIDWSDHARYPIQIAQQHMDFALVEGDVVLAMDRPWISSGFKVASIRASDLPALLVQRVARVRARDRFDRAFLFYLVRSSEFQRHCRPTETTVPHISPVEIRNFEFNLPPEQKRRDFDRTMQELTQVIEAMEAGNRFYESLFASLQHRAFRGEL